jgi:hypothetical protein
VLVDPVAVHTRCRNRDRPAVSPTVVALPLLVPSGSTDRPGTDRSFGLQAIAHDPEIDDLETGASSGASRSAARLDGGPDRE